MDNVNNRMFLCKITPYFLSRKVQIVLNTYIHLHANGGINRRGFRVRLNDLLGADYVSKSFTIVKIDDTAPFAVALEIVYF